MNAIHGDLATQGRSHKQNLLFRQACIDQGSLRKNHLRQLELLVEVGEVLIPSLTTHQVGRHRLCRLAAEDTAFTSSSGVELPCLLSTLWLQGRGQVLQEAVDALLALQHGVRRLLDNSQCGSGQALDEPKAQWPLFLDFVLVHRSFPGHCGSDSPGVLAKASGLPVVPGYAATELAFCAVAVLLLLDEVDVAESVKQRHDPHGERRRGLERPCRKKWDLDPLELR